MGISNKSHGRKTDKETQSPMLKIFKDIMQREKSDPEKTNLLNEKVNDRKRKVYSTSRPKTDNKSGSSVSERHRKEPVFIPVPEHRKSSMLQNKQNENPYKSEKKESWWLWSDNTQEQQQAAGPSKDETCSCVSCLFKKFAGSEYACLAILIMVFVVSVIIAFWLVFRTMPCTGSVGTLPKHHHTGFGDRLKRDDSVLKSSYGIAGYSGKSLPALQGLKELEDSAKFSELSSLFNSNKVNHMQNSEKLKDFYKKLIQTDARIRLLKKSFTDYNSIDNIDNKYKIPDRAKRSLKTMNKNEMRKGANGNYYVRRKRRLYNGTEPTGFVIEKKKVLFKYKPAYNRKVVPKCSHAPKDSKSHEKQLKHPFYKNTQRLDELLDQFLDRSLPEMMSDPFGLEKLFNMKSSTQFNQNNIKPNKVVYIVETKKDKTTSPNPKIMTQRKLKYDEINNEDIKELLRPVDNDILKGFLKDTKIEDKNPTITPNNIDVLLSISTVVNPKTTPVIDIMNPKYLNKRKLMQVEEEDVDIAYNDVNEVLSDEGTPHDDVEIVGDRVKRMDVPVPNQIQKNPLSIQNPNWKAPILYPEELKSVIKQAAINNYRAKNCKNKEQKDVSDVEYLEYYLNNEDDRLSKMAQAYSDYGVLEGRKDAVRDGKNINAEKDKDHRIKLSLDYDLGVDNFDRSKKGTSPSEGIRIEFRPASEAHRDDGPLDIYKTLQKHLQINREKNTFSNSPSSFLPTALDLQELVNSHVVKDSTLNYNDYKKTLSDKTYDSNDSGVVFTLQKGKRTLKSIPDDDRIKEGDYDDDDDYDDSDEEYYNDDKNDKPFLVELINPLKNKTEDSDKHKEFRNADSFEAFLNNSFVVRSLNNFSLNYDTLNIPLQINQRLAGKKQAKNDRDKILNNTASLKKNFGPIIEELRKSYLGKRNPSILYNGSTYNNFKELIQNTLIPDTTASFTTTTLKHFYFEGNDSSSRNIIKSVPSDDFLHSVIHKDNETKTSKTDNNIMNTFSDMPMINYIIDKTYNGFHQKETVNKTIISEKNVTSGNVSNEFVIVIPKIESEFKNNTRKYKINRSSDPIEKSECFNNTFLITSNESVKYKDAFLKGKKYEFQGHPTNAQTFEDKATNENNTKVESKNKNKRETTTLDSNTSSTFFNDTKIMTPISNVSFNLSTTSQDFNFGDFLNILSNFFTALDGVVINSNSSQIQNVENINMFNEILEKGMKKENATTNEFINDFTVVTREAAYSIYDSDMIDNIGLRSRVLLSIEEDKNNLTDMKNNDKINKTFEKKDIRDTRKTNTTTVASSQASRPTNNTKQDQFSSTSIDKEGDSHKNKTIVKRSADDNSFIFWNDIYDDEYGVNLDAMENIRDKHSIKNNNLIKSSKIWLEDKVQKLSENIKNTARKFRNRKSTKLPETNITSKGLSIISKLRKINKRNIKIREDDDQDDDKSDFATLTANMKEICRKAARAVKETRNMEVREDSKENSVSTSLMGQLMKLMTDLVDYQVQQKTCLRLPEDLQQFLQWLTDTHGDVDEDSAQKSYYTSDATNPDFDFGSYEKTTDHGFDPMDSPSSEKEVIIPERSDCLGTLRDVQDLILVYDDMSEQDKNIVAGVKEYLVSQRNYLQKHIPSYFDYGIYPKINYPIRYKRHLNKHNKMDMKIISPNNSKSDRRCHRKRKFHKFLKNFTKKRTRTTASYYDSLQLTAASSRDGRETSNQLFNEKRPQFSKSNKKLGPNNGLKRIRSQREKI